MAIDQAELRVVTLPLVAPFAAGSASLTRREAIIVTLRDGSLTGWGEVVAFDAPWYTGETVAAARTVLRDHLLPSILGRAIPDIATLLQLLAWVKGNEMAKAGVEMAWWDLHGQRVGRSLRDLLGGVRAEVPVGVSVGLQPSLPALVRRVEDYRAQGYNRIKIKVTPQVLEEPVRELRRVFGPDLPLQIDANSAFTLSDAPRFRALDDAGLLLIEQPLADDDFIDHAALQAQLATPICLDESITGLATARAALALNSCRVINVKPGRVGGLYQSLLIHDLCLVSGVALWVGGMLETGLGRAANLALATLPGFTLPGDISASARYYHRDIIPEPFSLNPNSTITVPTAPGLGVTVDFDALAAVTTHYEMVRR